MFMKSIRARYPDLPYAILLLGATIALFLPAIRWIAGQTMAHDQLRQSFFLLLFAAAILWIEKKEKLSLKIEIARRNLVLLAAAFLLMGIALFFPVGYLPLAALALAFAAFVHLAFGEVGFKMSFPWLAAFSAFLVFVFLFHGLDWPLRRFAGMQAAQVLSFLGNEVQLGELTQPRGMLLLKLNERIYEVAGECNGFGLMSSSTILALLLVVSRPFSFLWKIGAIAVAFFTGAVFSLIRILGIVGLAPCVGDHYGLMHEAVGIAALFSGLAFLWWLFGKSKTNRPAKPRFNQKKLKQPTEKADRPD